MIVVRRPEQPPLAADELGFIPRTGEKAYYVPVNNGEGLTTVQSSTGENWFPNLLNGKRVTFFIAGRQGAGKSYLTAQILCYLPDDAEILLFTNLSEPDGHFAPFADRIVKVGMRPDHLTKMLTLEEIRKRCRHPVCIFDDIDTIGDKKLKKAVDSVMYDILANGRGHRRHDGEGDVHVICTSHHPNNFLQTKYMIENTEYIAIPPQGTPKHQWNKLMIDKIGVPKELSDQIWDKGKTGAFRFAFVKQTAPMYVMFGDTLTLF